MNHRYFIVELYTPFGVCEDGRYCSNTFGDGDECWCTTSKLLSDSVGLKAEKQIKHDHTYMHTYIEVRICVCIYLSQNNLCFSKWSIINIKYKDII